MPPLDDCLGTRPMKAAKLLPFLKFEALPTETSAAFNVAVVAVILVAADTVVEATEHDCVVTV